MKQQNRIPLLLREDIIDDVDTPDNCHQSSHMLLNPLELIFTK